MLEACSCDLAILEQINGGLDKSDKFLKPHGAEYPCKCDREYGAEEEDEERNATCSLQR